MTRVRQFVVRPDQRHRSDGFAIFVPRKIGAGARKLTIPIDRFVVFR